MIEGTLIAIAAGVVALAALAFRSSSLLTKLADGMGQMKSVLPDKGLVARLTSTHEALTQSLDAQREAVRELPGNIAGTVVTEIRPLAESLSRSHDHFARAVLTLDHDGSLSEWVGGIREAVEPLQAVSSALEHHYQASGQVLRTTSGLVEQWASQREAVVLAFNRFSEVVERSAAAETTHLRDIEHRVMNRLEEVAETNATVAHALSELQTSNRNTLETQAGLARSIEATVQRVHELIDLGRHTQTQHHELIRTQQQVQKDLGTWQEEAHRELERLEESVGRISEGTAQALAQIRQEVQTSVFSLGKLLQDFHQAQGQALQQHQARQDELSKRQQSLLNEVSRILKDLPTRRYQLASMALFGVQILLTTALVFLLR